MIPGSVLYIVPTLGLRPEYLTETLRSMLTQDFPGIGVALVAPPGADLARAAADAHSLPFVEQSGKGMSNAINEGWRSLGEQYEFWAWLGDDDTLTPGSASRAVRYLQQHAGASMVYGRCLYVDADGRSLLMVHPSRLAARLMRWGPNLVPQPGSVARASAVRSAGLLDEAMCYAMDLDLFLKLKDVGRVAYLPVVLATFRWHEASTTVSGSVASENEARYVRVRTWSGLRKVGHVLEPLARLAGTLLHKFQRRRA